MTPQGPANDPYLPTTAQYGPAASRPTTALDGAIYVASDTKVISQFQSGAWQTVGGSSGSAAIAFGTAAARPAAGAGNANTGYYATDTGEITFSDGTTWNTISRTSANGIAMGAFGNITYGVNGNDFNITDINGDQVTGNSDSSGIVRITSGSLRLTHAGAGLRVAEGSNAKQGTAVLVGGTVTVANASITATSRIFLTSQADGGTPGFLRVSARVAGASFTITSSNAADTSTVAYEIFEIG